MLDAGGGGGGGGTSWSAMDVPTMWSTIETQETTPHWEMLTGWRRSFELISQHMSQVRNYRENLATAWPPEKSQASAAYIAELDDLLTNLQQTYDAAVANHTAFSTATLSLSSARTELKQIYDTYTANQAKLEEFNAKPKPVQYGKAPVPPQKPPVTGAQQEELNSRARALMSGLSTDLVQARMSITTPATYTPTNRVYESRTNRGETGDGAPAIPPVVPVFPTSENVRASGALATTPLPSAVDPSTSTRHPGIVLGGTQPGLVPLPDVGHTAIQSPPTTGAPLPTVVSPTTVGPMPPGRSTANAVTRPALGQPLMRSGPVSSSPPAGGRPLAPGGVIGAVPGMAPTPSAGSTSRVNPIGGVISPPGQQPARGKTGGGYPMGTIGRTPGDNDRSGDSKKWDPDNPWETAVGVPAVLTPAPEQPVDPGPAIGLS